MAHDSFAARGTNEITAEANQTARRNDKFKLGAAVIARFHVLHLTFANTQALDAVTDSFFGDIKNQGLKRFTRRPINGAEDHLWLGDLELIALAAHRLDQDAEVEFTATADGEAIRGVGVFNTQGDVCQQLLLQTVTHLTTGDELALLAGKR